jgi:hypothetical protein
MSACIVEALEKRQLFAAGLVSVTATPSPVERGLKLTLTANGNTSDTKRVSFWLDSNGNGVLDTSDKKIGQDGSPLNGLSKTFSTKKFDLGAVRFFARPETGGGVSGPSVSTTVTITDAPPTIKSVVASPKKVKRGKNLTFSANGVKDTDGTVGSVVFYIDNNANGSIDIGTDTFLGTDADKKGGFKFKPDTNTLPVGTLTILAQATDNDGGTSNVASGTVLVQT